MSDFLALILATATAATGNLLLKKAALQIGKLSFAKENLITELFKIFTNPQILLGLTFYVFGFLFWIKTLSGQDISKVYPILVSATITIILIGSSIFFKEQLTFARILGILVILVGIYIVFRT